MNVGIGLQLGLGVRSRVETVSGMGSTSKKFAVDDAEKEL